MKYTHKIDFELNCKINCIFSYCDYMAYPIEDIKDDMDTYLGDNDGFELIMDLGGWVFPDKDPSRYVSLYVYDLNHYSLDDLLYKIDKDQIDFAFLICDYEDCRFSSEGSVHAIDDKVLAKFIKEEFKKQVVELFL